MNSRYFPFVASVVLGWAGIAGAEEQIAYSSSKGAEQIEFFGEEDVPSLDKCLAAGKWEFHGVVTDGSPRLFTINFKANGAFVLTWKDPPVKNKFGRRERKEHEVGGKWKLERRGLATGEAIPDWLDDEAHFLQLDFPKELTVGKKVLGKGNRLTFALHEYTLLIKDGRGVPTYEPSLEELQWFRASSTFKSAFLVPLYEERPGEFPFNATMRFPEEERMEKDE